MIMISPKHSFSNDQSFFCQGIALKQKQLCMFTIYIEVHFVYKYHLMPFKKKSTLPEPCQG